MLRTRVIPCLLLQDMGLVKTKKFKDPKYVGDPINAVKIFNKKEVDELVFLDISIGQSGRRPNFALIEEIASEAFMPFAYGGGIRTLEDIQTLFRLGVEKVILNTLLFENPEVVKSAIEIFGSQSIVASLDVKKGFFDKYEVVTNSGVKKTGYRPEEAVAYVEQLGVGEIVITSIDKEGSMAGYDLDLIKVVSSRASVPIVANGGAAGVEDFAAAIKNGASAVAAGACFVYYGKHRAVLITYPGQEELKNILYREK